MMSRDAGEHRNGGTGTVPDRSSVGWAVRVLRVPLFWKLLLAHVGAVTVAVAAALWLAVRFDPDHPAWMTATIALLGGIGLSTLLTTFVLRVALAPVASLERAARKILEHGAKAFRLPVHPVADEELRDVVALFNSLLRKAADHRQQLRELAARALGSAETERRRVGLLLQDEVAQRLAAILVQIRLLGSATDRDDGDRILARAREQVVDTLEVVRRLARTLRPPELEELGLDHAVRALVRETREAAGCEVAAELEPVEPALSHPRALALFRIVQEALLVAVRTGGAPCRIAVHLFREGDAVIAEVLSETSTPGLEAWIEGEVEDPSAIGLMGMRERARFVGGSVSVERGDGGRARMRVRIPGEWSPED